MYGQPPSFRPDGSGRGVAQPDQPRQPIHMNPNFYQNPNLFINPRFLPHLNPFITPNTFPPIYQQVPGNNFPVPPNSITSHFQTLPQQLNPVNKNNISKLPQQESEVQKDLIGKLDKAVTRARRDLLSSNKNVSAWEVSQAALLMVKAESWESLGFQMQRVPSLNRLLETEGKINTFIHCFVAVRKITSLYDLEVAICENEGIERFEELELGPLIRHPLAVHYFSVTSELTEVYRIGTQELISYLCDFVDARKRKQVQVDSFLDFISKKQSVNGREKLCVRVQDIGLYVNHIKKARQAEDTVVQKCLESTRRRALQRTKKRALFSAQKKQLDDNFGTISQRIKSFSSEHMQFGGKHIRFMSSGSEDNDSEDTDEDYQDEKHISSNCNLSLPNVRPDHLSSCPYPSVTEEMTRLGLKSEVAYSPSAAGGGARCNTYNEQPLRKRKSETPTSTTSLHKLLKRSKFDTELKSKGSDDQGVNGHSLSVESLKLFVTTWKEACRGNNPEEVLERMLQSYNIRKKKKVKALFTSFPYVGLLNAAVTCMKFGMWDNMYDTFQDFGEQFTNGKTFDSSSDYISIGVEVAERHATISAHENLMHKHDLTAEDIAKKISGYFEDDISSFKSSSRENKFNFLRKLCKCEYWLVEQYSINEFGSLGYGEYFLFLDKYMHLLPYSLQKYLIGDVLVKDSLEAYLLPLQFDALLLQALNSLWENENVTLQNISDLLVWQFPSACFKPVKSDTVEHVADIIREKRITSNCLLFSASLLRFNCKGNSLAQNGKSTAETGLVDVNTGPGEGMMGTVTTKDAIDILLKAPMLTDLSLWSHWERMFAPSLGSIVEWFLKDVNNNELLCLVTKDAKVIRIDHLATTDSLLKVFAEGSAFETAVQLLSLFVLYGGERNVPLALLKCHARHAFELVINNALKIDLHGRPSCGHLTSGKSSNSYAGCKLPNNKSNVSKAVPVMSRFILECLSYLPIEVCSFAADILIAGTQFFSKDVTLGMLSECKHIEQRLMLHEVGMSLGLVEWVDDYHSFHSAASSGLHPGKSCLDIGDYELSSRSKIVKAVFSEHCFSSGEMLASTEADNHDVDCKTVGVGDHSDSSKVYVNGQAANSALSLFDNDMNSDPVTVIESIRKEEFGLDQSLSPTGSTMLEKQHARLGRALHCLSQELYSQDSHFLLELVQNADDNIYPKNVEPTLTFILQEKGITVMNNEQGFSAKNIRALCDVGNSTKKGNNAGYIGKKGIGFKSVFRVTDAPEIHSNGFHIKFDITEGQIGFVLPTVVPPCDVDLFTRLASANASCVDQDSWNTCIVLPFKSTLSESFAMNNIVSMFSDLHPSLLLFLHRLRCIKFRNMLDDSLVVMRKEVIGDGIIEVSLGNEKMTWFVVSQKLQDDVTHSGVQTTEISVAFTLQETADKVYTPTLNQQPVFAFLPLRTYGLKFILQGDFVLPSSREEVDGDSPWNQWLLSEFPDLLVNAEKSFCNLPCYRGSPGKAVTAFMSFIPLVGEVHGFFSSLPRVIISKLRMSNCLLSDTDENEWVPPCKVLRNWTNQTRSLLPDTLINKHLGLGFLNKDIALSDSLARVLGVEDYGPKILVNIISSLCHSADGLQSMGLSWLSSWLSAIYVMSSDSFMQASSGFGTDSDLIFKLQRTPFIPLSDGKYGSVHEDTIWLHSDEVSQGINDECVQKAFPKLNAKLRTVSPNLLAAAASVESSHSDSTILENVTRMLYKIGVQRLSAHEIVKVHILPALADDKKATGQEDFMIEYLSYAMFHLHSSCNTCSREREGIITELRDNALISTNFGYRRFNEVPLHFSREYGNPVDVNKLISGMGEKWHEIDNAYLKHSITKSISDGELKWRRFFQELGATDFVKIVQLEKCVAHINTKDAIWAKDMMMPMDAVANNWESEELLHLLSWLSTTKDWEKSKYLLEILDILWDNYFSDKAKGYYIDSTGESKSFKSSLISILQDVQWIVSNIDKELHYPKDLFHDCVAVSSVLGVGAPYTVPKVRSEKLVADIGLRTQVTLDGALSVLRHWRISESPFKASISQMSNFYTLLWKAMPLSKEQVIEELLSGPFIFVPYASCCSQDDAVPGALLSPQDVYWHDTIGNVDQVKSIHSDCVTGKICYFPRKMLCNIYPNLHDFFVNGCGVDESLPFRSYLQILLQLSAISLPHQAAERVFEVFLRWSDALKSGSLSLEDIEYLKKCLLKEEYAVLPTRQDKWVSLHASSGLICWSDDDDLAREFKHFEGVDFLYFGEFTDEENQIYLAKISTIIQRLGIPALSQIVTREAIYYGPADSSFVFSLVNWVLPYAQRYILNVHTDRYYQLKQSGFENITQLKIVVVEELFYQNAIKRCNINTTSKKRYVCNCLLQDNILYCRQGSDLHAIFMEFSRVPYNGTTDLHLANFLLMVTTMAESGADEEQTEFFILNSQKVPILPVDEACWSLQTDISLESNSKLLENCLPQKVEQNYSMFKGRSLINSSWPPVDWKTAPGFKSRGAFGTTKPANRSLQITGINVAEENQEQVVTTQTEISHEFNIEHDPMVITPGAILLNAEGLESQSNPSSNLVSSGMNAALESVDFGAPDIMHFSQPNSYGGDKLFGQQEALLTGRLGELTAFKYFVRNLGNVSVNWVNEANETGLPYDIIIGDENNKEYVEVKATKATRKNWFLISMREWQFAVEKGESFSIAHVILSDADMAKVTIYKNPAKLCQLGNIKLAVVVPKK